jgi:hypothetical protein
MVATAVMSSAAMPTATVVVMEVREMAEVNRPDQRGRAAIRPPRTESGFVEGGHRGNIRPDRFRAGYQGSRQDDRCEDSEPAHILDMVWPGRVGKRAGVGQTALQAIVMARDPAVNANRLVRLRGEFAFLSSFRENDHNDLT